VERSSSLGHRHFRCRGPRHRAMLRAITFVWDNWEMKKGLCPKKVHAWGAVKRVDGHEQTAAGF
jgi:hypothetical protein